MKVCLIISSYNRPDALELVLKSLGHQTVYPDEIIIADDGSGDATRSLIESYNRNTMLPVKHVWQADEGFRLARVRNLGLAQASADYVIFLDGDMVLHPRFVASHVHYAQKGYFLQGSRVILSNFRSLKMIEKGHLSPGFFASGVTNRQHMIHSRWLSKLFSRVSDRWDTVRGCSMSYWMSDLVRVNGFDEAYHDWGREDNDIAVRMMNAGIQRKNLKFCAVAYHLYHPERKLDEGLLRNDELLKETVAQKRIRCVKGLDGHLDR